MTQAPHCGISRACSVHVCSGKKHNKKAQHTEHKTLPLHPSQHCQNMYQTPIYSRRRGSGLRAKPQPSAMLNRADFALAWTLSPFPLSLLPRLVKTACTQERLWLLPATTHDTRRHAEEQRLGTLVQGPEKRHTNPSKGTPRQPEPWQAQLPSAVRSDLADTGKTAVDAVGCARLGAAWALCKRPKGKASSP